MVNPVTGPFTTTGSRSGSGPGTYRWSKTKYKQAKPYNLPLTYVYFLGANQATNYSVLAPDNGAASGSNPAAGYTHLIRATDPETYSARFRAMEKFRESLASRAEWLVNLAERNQAVKMITSRATQLFQLARAVKRFDIGGINRALNVPRGMRPLAKTASGLWLEYHFGWEPMIKDVYAGIDILQQPIRDKPVYGVGSTTDTITYTNSDSSYETTSVQDLTVKARVGAYVAVTNPNLWLANRLGLVNPASVIWEMVPFSFVVDWYIPVSTFLNSYSEFYGLSITRQFTSTLTHECVVYEKVPIPPRTIYTHCVNTGVSMNRVLSLPAASLRPPSPRGLSLTRAATAISLLIQQLKSF